jgi:hypothetical protein
VLNPGVSAILYTPTFTFAGPAERVWSNSTLSEISTKTTEVEFLKTLAFFCDGAEKFGQAPLLKRIKLLLALRLPRPPLPQ